MAYLDTSLLGTFPFLGLEPSHSITGVDSMRNLPLDLTSTRNRHYIRNTIVVTSAIQGGLKQGNFLSLSLFNFALECVIKKVQASQKGFKFNERHRLLFCADDINPLNTKGRLLYLKTQFVPRSKRFSSRL